MKVTISGPGEDETREGAGVGLSLATTFANRATKKGEEATFYVRDLDGNVIAWAESDGQGSVTSYGTATLLT